MGRPRAAKLKREGRGAHGHVWGIWRKHTVELSPINSWSVGQVTCCMCVEPVHYLLGARKVSRSCSRGSGSWLKMRVGAWLLWVSWFCTWAELSQRGECHDACPTESGPDSGSRSRVKEHVRHGAGHQHTPHRSRPHRRKGESLKPTRGFRLEARFNPQTDPCGMHGLRS